MIDTGVLEDIGLTNAEIKVYLALLGLGSSTAGPIIEKSGLQNSVVHMTLNKLIGKGLISFIKEGKKHVYQAANPKHILDGFDEKREHFESLLPQLLAIQQVSEKKPEVTVFRGKSGIRELFFELLDAVGTEHHTFGASKNSLMMSDAWWVSYHRKRAKKGIVAKLLFNESLRFWKTEAKIPKCEVRYSKEGFEPSTETIIRDDRIGIILWIENPIGIMIHQKEAAESYDKFFQLMWKSAGGQSPPAR